MADSQAHKWPIANWGWLIALWLGMLGLNAQAKEAPPPWQLSLHFNPGVLEMWQLQISSPVKGLPSSRFDGYRTYVLRSDQDEALGKVAASICQKIGWEPGSGDERIFLEAYYTALRARLERSMKFGRRRKDKFSPHE